MNIDVDDSELRALALSVSRCPQIEPARRDGAHPCHQVVTIQRAEPDQWQVPEGWAGNLAGARVVFLSSNPSISEPIPGKEHLAEAYPNAATDDETIADFMVERFPKFASADGRYRQRDGAWSSRPVKFWRATRAIASNVLGAPADPAVDYVLTEVVHCKSKGEHGVAKAVGLCSRMHMDRVLSAAPHAPLIVILGGKALKAASVVWNLPADFGPGHVAVRQVGGVDRALVALRHPAVYGPLAMLEETYPEAFKNLQALVAGLATPEDVRVDALVALTADAEAAELDLFGRPSAVGPAVPPRSSQSRTAKLEPLALVGRQAADEMSRTLAKEGLAAPPAINQVASRVVEYGPWHWGTAAYDPRSLYMFRAEVARQVAGDGQDHLLLCHAGHGVNSYALTLVIARGPVLLMVQDLFGGIYTDPVKSRVQIAATFAHAHVVLQQVGESTSPIRWFGRHSSLRDVHELEDTTTGNVSSFATQEELFAALSRVLPSGPEVSAKPSER